MPSKFLSNFYENKLAGSTGTMSLPIYRRISYIVVSLWSWLVVSYYFYSYFYWRSNYISEYKSIIILNIISVSWRCRFLCQYLNFGITIRIRSNNYALLISTDLHTRSLTVMMKSRWISIHFTYSYFPNYKIHIPYLPKKNPSKVNAAIKVTLI